MKLFVSNPHFTKVAETELRDAFERFGQVREVRLIRDRTTDRSKGYAFVIMAIAEDGEMAIKELHKTTFNGRPISVVEARDEHKR